MRQLQKIVDDYTKAKKESELDPGEFHFGSRPGIEIGIRAAKDRLAGLRAEYRQCFLSGSLGVFAFGPVDKIDELTKYAKSHDIVLVDGDEMYRRIAKAIEPTIGSSRTFTAHQGAAVLGVLREIGMELRIASIKVVDFGQPMSCPTLDSVTAHIRDRLRQSLGDDLNKMYIEASAVQKGLDLQYGICPTPVIVINAVVGIADLATSFGRGTASVDLQDNTVVADEWFNKSLKEAQASSNKKKRK